MPQHIKDIRECGGQISSWATEVEIEALSRMLGCSVYVLVKEGRSHTWACYSDRDGVDDNGYLVLAHRGGNHFNLVIPANGSCYCQVVPPRLSGRLEALQPAALLEYSQTEHQHEVEEGIQRSERESPQRQQQDREGKQQQQPQRQRTDHVYRNTDHVFNYSSKELTKDQKRILSYGLTVCTKPQTRPNKADD